MVPVSISQMPNTGAESPQTWVAILALNFTPNRSPAVRPRTLLSRGCGSNQVQYGLLSIEPILENGGNGKTLVWELGTGAQTTPTFQKSESMTQIKMAQLPLMI